MVLVKKDSNANLKCFFYYYVIFKIFDDLYPVVNKKRKRVFKINGNDDNKKKDFQFKPEEECAFAEYMTNKKKKSELYEEYKKYTKLLLKSGQISEENQVFVRKLLYPMTQEQILAQIPKILD